MILEDAIQLEALAAEVIALRRSQQHSQSLAHRRQLVVALLERASVAAASGAAISERLDEVPPSAPAFESALTRITKWRSALGEDLGKAISGELFGGFQDSVEKAVRELERRSTDAWQRYVAQTTPETSDEVLAALAADPRARSTVLRIRRLSETLRRLRDRPLPTVDEVAEFDTETAALRSAWATLDVASLNDEIVAFLRAANSDRGAPLGLLTTSVIEWLEQRSAASHYVIRPGDQ
jgi:hypothetical protein